VKHKAIVRMAMFLLLTIILSLLNIQPVVEGLEMTSENEPLMEFKDFHNGTRRMIIDYQNGTLDRITETFVRKEAKLQINSDQVNQSLSMTLNTTTESSVLNEDPPTYVNTTQTITAEQEVQLGFTWDILHERFDYSEGIFLIGYVIMGIDVDIQFGLRLPVNITFEYPEQMTIGENYTLYTTLVPIDKPNFNEFLFRFGARVWAEANMLGIQLARYDTSEEWGGYIDKSKSFVTPLGSEVTIFEDLFNLNLFDLMTIICPALETITGFLSLVFVPYITFEPAFGSNKITAKAAAHGDALVIKGENLLWSTPGQRLDFIVNADDYSSSTNYTKISISDFKYYFSIFQLNVGVLFDLNDVLNAIWSDPAFDIGTLDLSFLTEGLYLETHPGTIGRIDFSVYVERFIPPPIVVEPRDVGILWASVSPQIVYTGQILNITVTIGNLGNVTEDVNVTARINTIPIGTQTVLGLEPKENFTLYFYFNTSGLTPNTYNIIVEVSEAPYEIDTTDNQVLVTMEVGLPEYTLTIVSVPDGITFKVNGQLQTTPWSKIYYEETTVTVEMPETYNRFIWSHWSEDGDTNRTKTITLPASTYTAVYVSLIGGNSNSIKSEYFSSWIASILLLIAIVVSSSIYVKRKRS